MPFNSFNAFLDMGGYGFYVWLAFLVTFFCIAGLVLEQNWRTRKLRKDVLKEHRRLQRINKVNQSKKAASANS